MPLCVLRSGHSKTEMSDYVKTGDDRIYLVLSEIRDNQVKEAKARAKQSEFNAGTVVSLAFIAAFGFVMALAINAFLTMLFALIPVGDGLLGAGIYALVAIVLCVAMIFVLAVYVAPWLSHMFERKHREDASK